MPKSLAVAGLVTLAILLAPVNGSALIGLNECGPGLTPPKDLRCAADQLLLGYRNATGACMWVCCPPNGDGKSYDCSSEPTASHYKLDLGKVQPKPWSGIFTPTPSPDSQP